MSVPTSLDQLKKFRKMFFRIGSHPNFLVFSGPYATPCITNTEDLNEIRYLACDRQGTQLLGKTKTFELDLFLRELGHFKLH